MSTEGSSQSSSSIIFNYNSDHVTTLQRHISRTYGQNYPLYTEIPLGVEIDLLDPHIQNIIKMLKNNQNYRVKATTHGIVTILGIMDHMGLRWFDLH